MNSKYFKNKYTILLVLVSAIFFIFQQNEIIAQHRRNNFKLIRSIPINEGENNVITKITDLTFINKDKILFCDSEASWVYVLDLKNGTILHSIEADTSLSMRLMNSNEKPMISMKQYANKNYKYVDSEILEKKPHLYKYFQHISNTFNSVFSIDNDYYLMTQINPLCYYDYNDSTKGYNMPICPCIIRTDSTFKIKSIQRLKSQNDTVYENNSIWKHAHSAYYLNKKIYAPGYFTEIFLNDSNKIKNLSIVSYNLDGELLNLIDSIPKIYVDAKFDKSFYNSLMASVGKNIFVTYEYYFRIKNVTNKKEFNIKYIDSVNLNAFSNLIEINNNMNYKDIDNKYIYSKSLCKIFSFLSNNNKNLVVLLSILDFNEENNKFEKERYALEYDLNGVLLNEFKFNNIKNEQGYLSFKMFYNKYNDTYVFSRFSKEKGFILEEYKWE